MNVIIQYERMGNGVYWQLRYADGSPIHLFVTSENGHESNKSKARKAAEHAKRLTEAAIEGTK